MSKTPFVHLHVHSYFSLLDGLGSPEDYVKKAVEYGSPALAITDHGTMHGCIDHYKACKKHGIKPIIGCEVYIAFNKLTDKRHQIDNKRTHCILLAETQEGYENLLKMTTIAHLDGFYYKPRVDWDLLKKYSKGLIALTACIAGDVPQAILNNDKEKVDELVERFQSVFGKDNFFLELQNHPEIPQQGIVNQGLIELSKEKNIPLVVTADTHYVEPEDNITQDIMICIQTGRNLSDTNRMSMMNADFSLHDPDVLAEVFKDTPEAISNTVKIAERCNVEFEFGVNHIPNFPIPDDKESEETYLRELCIDGLILKYKFDPDKFKRPNPITIESDDKEIKEKIDRLEFELKIISDMGFVGYFLIVWDFVKWAKDHNIIVGPGRGSAAGAIVAYTLDVTEIDPLEYNLLFERFLNPARVSMPDIDMDFADNRRDEVIEYVAEKYGRDRVAQICTFGTFAARAAVKDVGRTLGISFAEMNEFVKLIPDKPGTKLQDALDNTKELKEAVDNNDMFQQVVENALKLEGAVRHVSVHACAVIIAPDKMTNYTALQHPSKDENGIITQYSAKPLDALGLLKMDFLGLKNLTILQTALKIIERTKGVKINLQEIPVDDKKTFALLSRGETTGVFQLESSGMRRYLKELRPKEFEDIIAMVSLYRPGPMEWIPDYISGSHGKKEVKYIHPSLEPILKKTYGIAIYQEQILQIAQAFSGFSLGEADLLRRAIGKKIIAELEAQRDKFINGAIEKGHSKKLAIDIFENVIEPFAGYGFNKSHAACYAMIAYQTAYLKARYPTEFMAALMSADAQNADRIVIEIGECENIGIKVLPPDVNESLANFTFVEDGKIRFGLSAIKGMGRGTVDMIIEARTSEDRPFDTLEDFARRVPPKVVNKKTVEALAFSGAVDGFGDRKQIGYSYESISSFAKTASGGVNPMQAGLFDTMEEVKLDHLELADVSPATDGEKLKWEKELLGLYVSSHPLAGTQKYFSQKTIPLNKLSKMSVGNSIKVGGILTSIRKIQTKKGDMMAIVFIEDTFGKTELVIFPKTYRKFSEDLEEDRIVLVEGKLERRNGEMQVVVEKMKPYILEDFQAEVKAAGLWTDGEKVVHLSNEDIEGEQITCAEEVLDIKPEDEQELASDSLFENKKARQILITKTADKEFFLAIKAILEKHLGSEDVELIIRDTVLPLPIKVTWNADLDREINEFLDQ